MSLTFRIATALAAMLAHDILAGVHWRGLFLSLIEFGASLVVREAVL